jgi:archaellum component FlaC
MGGCNVEWRMVDKQWIGKDLEGNCRDLIDALSRDLNWVTKENHEQTRIRIVDISTKIRTELLLYANLKRYR